MALRFLKFIVVLISISLSTGGFLKLMSDNNRCSQEKYSLDQASITFISNLNSSLHLFSKSQNCWKCALMEEATIHSKRNISLNFSTNFDVDLFLIQKSGRVFCNLTMKLHDMNKYNVELTETSCNVTSECSNSTDPNIPVYALLGYIIILYIIYFIGHNLWRKGWFAPLERFILKMRNNGSCEEETDARTSLVDDGGAGDNQAKVDQPRKMRINSIDAFRGFSLVLMVFVNYGGGGYWYFRHAAWDGLTVADIVFPWFVFIMGMSMTVSFKSRLQKGVSRFKIFKGILSRSCLLFFLGLVLSNKNCTLADLRIFGVLQRLAVTYFCVGVVETFDALPTNVHINKWWSHLRDVIKFWKGWTFIMSCVIVHTCLTFLLPVPGCPLGYLGPGGLHDDGQHKECTGGAAGHIDRLVLGTRHMYQHPTCQKTYKTTVPYDPEGILGTLLCIVLCYFGVQAGRILTTYSKWRSKLWRWFVWVLVQGLVGGALCNFEQFGGVIPINKNLWSFSYTLVLSSMALTLYSIFYFLIDYLRIWTGTPFIYPGMNSIAIFIGSELLQYYFPLHLYNPTSHWTFIFKNLWSVKFWLIVSAIMHKKKIFISL